MSENEPKVLDVEKLKELGVPNELVEQISNTGMPSVTTHAQGGKGGHSINLTYIDNYSTLLLVYTFLLNTLDDKKGSKILNEALLSTLNTVMEEQQEYRAAFLKAVESLNVKPEA